MKLIGENFDNTALHEVDFCIVGGGLAGTIAALSAARHGMKVVLMQDRPMLGGNCSSEVRLYIRGAKKLEDRETGILNEFEEENIYRNAELSNSVWDSVLLGKVFEEKNITLLTNCSCLAAEKEGDSIVSVTGWQLNTYTFHTVKAKYFADCSGDCILAPLVGAEFIVGREGKNVYGESLAPDESDSKTMGMSCLLQAREVDHKVEFIPPAWANVYETDDDIGDVKKDEKIGGSRCDVIATSGSNLWWMEISSKTDGITDTEECRRELMKVAYGIWDHVKNRDNPDHKMDNWELEWVGVLPGKRGSRRYIGDYVLVQDDVLNPKNFDDTIAYGGWPLDVHDPQAMESKVPTFVNIDLEQSYPIPYRTLFSKNVDNLFFAGRNISASHVAYGSARVLGTCALLGQAVGTGAAVCNKYGVLPKQSLQYIKEIQNDLMEDGIYLPYRKRNIPLMNLRAKTNLSEEKQAVLLNGMDRDRNGVVNSIEIEKGESVVYDFGEEKQLDGVRIVFDLDYSRESISPNLKMRRFAMRMFKGKDFVPVKVANTIVKDFDIYADGKLVKSVRGNYRSFIKLPLAIKAKKVEVKFLETHGYEKVRLFGCDFY